ncbi:MAG: hypothetical protein R2695_08650 [Acidimicrobiales bacterium]
MEINQVGAYTGIHVVGPAIVAAGGGSIVNVSSVNGFVGAWGIAQATCRRVRPAGAHEVAALELARKGAGQLDPPGTHRHADAGRRHAARWRPGRRHEAAVPVGRVGEAAEVALVALSPLDRSVLLHQRRGS